MDERLKNNDQNVAFSNRQQFLRYVAQTSPEPIGLEIERAEGIYQFDRNGKKYVDLISGFSVCNIGHGNAKVVAAVQQQAAAYMHLIVYGEFIESPQVQYAKLLTEHLPQSLNTVYFTNSGTEATEGAMKLAKRVTGKTDIICFNRSYHGSTQGALSLIGDEYWRNAFRPLLPGIHHFDYNSNEVLAAVNDNIACVILETVQAESGVNKPSKLWMQQLCQKCKEENVLVIIDEIQAGFGRTGSLWAFEQFDIIPDILLLGKALGGGMPLGAFIAGHELMRTLTFDPVLGHITTFGGHPVCCAAGKAAFEVLTEHKLISTVLQKEAIIKAKLTHPHIKQLRTAGLWASIEFESSELNKRVVRKCLEKGLITDWFLFAPNCLRIAPPLIISDEELESVCKIILSAVDEAIQTSR